MSDFDFSSKPKRKPRSAPNPWTLVVIAAGVFTVAAVAIALALVFGGNPAGSVPASAGAPLFSHELWAAYGSNEIQADQKYTGKLVSLKGEVAKVSKDANGLYVVGFPVGEFPAMSPEQFAALPDRDKKWFREGVPAGVLCQLNEEGVKALASAGAAPVVGIRGVCIGKKIDPDVYGGYVVILKNCQPWTTTTPGRKK